jgi:hypothetical protein
MEARAHVRARGWMTAAAAELGPCKGAQWRNNVPFLTSFAMSITPPHYVLCTVIQPANRIMHIKCGMTITLKTWTSAFPSCIDEFVYQYCHGVEERLQSDQVSLIAVIRFDPRHHIDSQRDYYSHFRFSAFSTQ